jgi:hypothetical protein
MSQAAGGEPPDRGMPAWLAQLVLALSNGRQPASNGQQPAGAESWAERIRAELARLAGQVPFAVVHDWHAGTVAPLLAELCPPMRPVGALHSRALAGQSVGEAEWAAALEPALRELYRGAYDYPAAYAVNYANAEVYGTANGFGEQGTREYASYYAELATGANLRAYAEANAIANARLSAAAFATADPASYAEAFPYAAARGYAQAWANAAASTADPADPAIPADPAYQVDPADLDARLRAAYLRLADGLAESLARVEPEVSAGPN